MKHICAPEPWPSDGRKVFLAGSIEMGVAARWQDALVAALADTQLILLNPRRSQWDPTWRQSPDNPDFARQVNWELDALDAADLVVMYLDPQTKSPISLLELGLHARSGKIVVCCPEGFWRRGNVQIVCMRHAVQMVEDLGGLEAEVRKRLC
jgi:hypothetical protein